MKLLSINVAEPVAVEQAGRSVATAIFKKPVAGPVYVGRMNLDGDRQGDSKNHGGADKAVYAFSYDHYAYWSAVLNKPDMPYGQFGENLSIAGLDEALINIGDQLEIGGCLLEVSQPRIPCFKLGLALDVPNMPRLFIERGATGIYFRVLREGEIATGDPVEIVRRGRHQLAVKTLFTSYFDPQRQNPEALATALEIPELALEWRRKILNKSAG
ncbi:MAG: MOSC domain-containing protein [Gammaproteobacteria bacterium HGW-Gammaproteobacteria-10]|nr:MAG: MOSC domain-containing protein [Gammaproteobacteria bacterium HGW-Gammaproteobacteria-3]PKM35394.1 MAG: MOSC domain-containing protein [Gammaproteobacteria bacterium HGW-Gammaproteobacteria-10]